MRKYAISSRFLSKISLRGLGLRLVIRSSPACDAQVPADAHSAPFARQGAVRRRGGGPPALKSGPRGAARASAQGSRCCGRGAENLSSSGGILALLSREIGVVVFDRTYAIRRLITCSLLFSRSRSS